MLGSRTILRVLAAVYTRLTTTREGRRTVPPMKTRPEVLAFFKSLDPLMQLPLPPDSPWFATGAFTVPEEGGRVPTAPLSRQQDLKRLTDEIVRWAMNGIPEE